MKKLNRDDVKYIAIFAMLLDHIAWYFLPFGSLSAQVFHTVGRTTAPIMCFFIAEGYVYTRNKKKYFERLFIFALISQFPWWLLHSGQNLSFNMMFTLFFGLLAIHVEASCKNSFAKYVLIFMICAITYFCDWKIFAVLWCLGFFKFHENPKQKFAWFSIVALSYFIYALYQNYVVADIGIYRSLVSSLYCFGTFLSIPLLLSYNGQKGKLKANKWIFYIFYPLHLLVIAIILVI